MQRPGIYLLFFCSGAAGLVYQVIWVRQFGNIFGNTVYSAALVTAVFMSGLGLGGYLAGAWADRQYAKSPGRLLRYYGYFELAIALSGLAVALVLTKLEPLSAWLSSYVQEGNGWYSLSLPSSALRYVLAVVLLLPMTTFMGGTLTLLIRHLVRSDLSVAGVRVGALYGINTAGAALGALLVDFALVPTVGLFATESLAVVVNLCVSLAALRWAARAEKAAGAVVEEPEPPVEEGRDSATGPVVSTGLAIFLSGFAAMGMEILWFRLLSTLHGAHRATFSILLTVILVGIWLGSIVGGAADRRLRQPARLFIIAQGAFAASTLLLMLGVDQGWQSTVAVLWQEQGTASWTTRQAMEVWSVLRPALTLAGPPAFLMGFAYPLANACIQRSEGSVGKRAGLLYLSNTAGAVVGSLAAGFLLVPLLGMQSSFFVLALFSIASSVPLLVVARSEGSSGRGSRAVSLAAFVAVAAACAVAAHTSTLPSWHLARRLYSPADPRDRLMVMSEDVNESIIITERQETGERRLYTNGHPMSGTNPGAQRYMRAFAHVPLLQMDDPEGVLVICFGVGNTLHAASLHPSVKTLEIVDLSRHVLRHAPYFARWNKGVLEDPRVSVFVNDGRQHLRMQPEGSYDLITLEPPPISSAGVGALYSKEFYELASSRLRAGGFVTQWLPVYQVPGPVVLASVRAFLDSFPEAILLSGYEAELILMGRKGAPLQADPARIVERLEARPAVWNDLKQIDMGTLTELLGAYAGSGATLAKASGGMPPLTDDLPLLEYGPRVFKQAYIPGSLFDPLSVDRWCPRCGELEATHPELEELGTYLAAMDALYSSPVFRLQQRVGDCMRIDETPVDPERLLPLYERSGYLRDMFAPPAEE